MNDWNYFRCRECGYIERRPKGFWPTHRGPMVLVENRHRN